MSKIIKIIDERETQKQKNKQKTNKETKNRKRGTEATAKGWEINDFVERLS